VPGSIARFTTEEAFMLSSVLALITCAAIPVNQPLDTTAQMSTTSPAVEVGAYVTATSFQCRNFSTNGYLLVFGQTGTSTTVTVPLPASASVAYSATPDMMRGVYVEAVAVTGSSTFGSSGAISLALPANSSDMSLWFVPGPSGLMTWEQIGCDVELVIPGDSMIQSSLTTSPPQDETFSASQIPTGVPIGSSTSTPPQSLPPM
jgi:hypothetical protein